MADTDHTPVFISTQGMTKGEIMQALQDQLDKFPDGDPLPNHTMIFSSDTTGKGPGGAAV